MRTPARKTSRRGSALSLTIIVSVVITGMVMTMAWTAGMQAGMTRSYAHLDRAFYAAESGAQRLAWYAKKGKINDAPSPLKGSIGGYDYTATWQTITGNQVRITSQGSLGSVSSTCHMTVEPGVKVPPTLATNGDFDNKNMKIEGDLIIGGNYTNGGSGKLEGNLVYGGTATNTGNVTGETKQGSFPTIDIAGLRERLKDLAGQKYDESQTNKHFNFDAVSGADKVIYVEGDVVNPTFTGTGTLVVKGNVIGLGVAGAFGAKDYPVNIVAEGNITTDKNLKAYGTLYASGDWYRDKVDLTGLVYVGGIDKSNNGTSRLKMTAAPWFDPRAYPIAGGGSTRFTNFAGVTP